MAFYEKIPGMSGIGGINFAGIFSGTMQFVIIIILFLLVGGFFFVIIYKIKEKKKYNQKLSFFEEVRGNPEPVKTLWAKVITIPNTNIKVFYEASQDLYLPQATRKMGKNSFWYFIKKNGEIVNFTIKNMNEEFTAANLDYDHTDMRYAMNNLRNLIQRNFRDKSTKWWQEYKDVISVVILLFVMSLSFYFIISKTGQLIDRVGDLLEVAKETLELANAQRGSGVING